MIRPPEVHGYAVFIALAMVIGIGLTLLEARRRNRLDDRMLFVISTGLAGGLIGAKLSMVIFLGPSAFWELRGSLATNGAAMTGALLGGFTATTAAEILTQLDVCAGDLAAPFIALGQAIGRLGNLVAADAYGKATSLPWGIEQAGTRRHPVQVYELLLDLMLFGTLFWYRTRSFRDGELFRLYILGYAVIRFPLEFLRYQPTPRDFLGLTLVQWLCLASGAFCAYQLVLIRKGIPCACALPLRRSTPA